MLARQVRFGDSGKYRRPLRFLAPLRLYLTKVIRCKAQANPSYGGLYGSWCKSRSTYLAITSTSRLTSSPGFSREKFVSCQVFGITAISKTSLVRLAIVRLIPSTETEPLNTRYRAISLG